MNLEYFIDRLSKNCVIFEGLVRNVTPEQATWKPAPDTWSILEVINHLYDEEREDFRARLNLTLFDPQKDWPPIDPPGWVTARGYDQRELETSLNNFLVERQTSLSWLRELEAPNWENRHLLPNGSRSAGDLLASWLAHDFLHIRQLARLHWKHIGSIAAPHQTEYAGPWKESWS